MVNCSLGSQLLWAIMDQFVIHLSINHATLPRIQIFLSNLQTGLLDMQIPTVYRPSRFSKRSQPDRTKSNQDSTLQSHHTRLSWCWPQMLGMTSSKASSISEHPLQLRPELDIELSTVVHADNGGPLRNDDIRRGYGTSTREGVIVKEVRVAYNEA
jgi:hypothetical protein